MFFLFLRCRYSAGTANRDRRVDVSKPLKTTVPMLILLAEPVPPANNSGKNPASDVTAVSTIGRILLTAALRIASPNLSPCESL